MSDELIKRLRAFPQIVHVAGSPYWLHVGGNEPLCADAADALERVTRELAKTRCPIGLDDNHLICSAGTCLVCRVDRMASYRERAQAAEAEVERLRKALAQIKEHAEFNSDGEDAVSQAGVRGGQLGCIRDILAAIDAAKEPK